MGKRRTRQFNQEDDPRKICACSYVRTGACVGGDAEVINSPLFHPSSETVACVCISFIGGAAIYHADGRQSGGVALLGRYQLNLALPAYYAMAPGVQGALVRSAYPNLWCTKIFTAGSGGGGGTFSSSPSQGFM